MANTHLHSAVRLLVVLSSLLHLGVHCQTTKSSECPGYRSCSSGQCDNSEICIDGQCKARCINETASGECMECQDRLYGKQCKNECPCTCLNSRCHLGNKSHVKCTEGCKAGWKGGKCSVQCPKNCPLCERYGEKCESCSQGHYGENCHKFCPENCKGSCNIITGECTCEPGYRGKQCTIKCPEDCGSDCDLSKCECQVGYSGAECEEMCPQNCEAGCDRVTGQCFKCKSGYRGGNCSETCPPKCEEGCDRETGECSKCKSGFKGGNCSETCPPNCEEGCNRETGECSKCKSGFKGGYCSETCPPKCEEGCDRETRECSKCKSGFKGGYCNSMMMDIGIGLTVAAILGCVFLIGFILWKRMQGRTEADNEEKDGTVEMDNIKMTEFLIRDFTTTNPTYMLSGGDVKQVKYCKHFQGKDRSEKIEEEFQKLPSPDSRETKCASMESNASKNRYKDVLPFDETRVSLDVWEEGTSDYINASFITGYRNQIQYVASQGPNIHVVDDFWRMIWQQNTTKIVMLTNLVEAGKIKCEMYWPFCSSDFQRYGRVCVQCVEEKVYQHHTLRTLAVWKDSAKTRTVLQFHFTSWPDHGVPDEKSIIDFHRVVKNTGYNALAPLVIHCSAGVGRSGTFIALDFLLDQARYEGRVCIFNCIQQFRYQRMKMVQTKDQYRFLYDILVSALEYRGTLPRYYAPVVIECPDCWDQKTEKSHEDEFTLEENNIEYQPLWNCGLTRRETYRPRSDQPEACAIISENSPPLTSVISMETVDEGHADDLEKQRISWDTAL